MASTFWKLAFASVLLSVVLALPGGRKPADIHNKDVQEIADFAVQEVDAGSNSMLKSKLIKLTKVETQVVSGTNYHLTFDMGETNCHKGSTQELSSCELSGSNVRECKVTVWDQPWTKTRQVTDQSCTDKTESLPSKPSAPKLHSHNKLIGGPTKLDQSTEEVQAAARFAVEEMNARTNSMNRLVLQDIVKAHRQTVSGFKYKLQVKIGLSTCRNNQKNKGATIDKCPLDQNAEAELCKFNVLQQVWQNPQYKLLDFKCHGIKKAHNATKPKHLLGGDGHDNGPFMQFQAFKASFKKSYPSHQEERRRYGIFVENMKKIEKLQHAEKGTAKYGITKFADMPDEEFRKYYLTPTWDTSYDPFLKPAVIPQGPAPAAFDWRDHGAVTPVKNQGQCGSCWAFSVTGNIEGQWAVNKKALVPLSEQELVDCDKLDDGCEGGLPTNAYKEIIRLGGLETETEYPYDAEDEKCKFKVKDARIYINSSVNISSNEADMAAWLAKNGPISIGINANAMQFYMGGVSHPWSFLCNPDSLDHGVLIVGYGVEKGYFSDSPYWIVKNSWGENWGEKGYYRVYRGDGTCGLNKMPTSAVVG